MASNSIGQPPQAPQPDIVPNGPTQPLATPPEQPPTAAAAGPASAEAQGGQGAYMHYNGISFGAAFINPVPTEKFLKELEAIKRSDPFQNTSRPTIANMKTARLGRPCIVENMYYQDVGHIVAPGGTGKTTILLHHCIEIVTGGNIFGCEVQMPGPVVYLTAEDNEESIYARIWQMVKDWEHDPEREFDLRQITEDLHIMDAVGHGDIKLTTVAKGGGIVPSGRLETLLTTLKRIQPVMVFIDPLIAFGVGEARVNDAEEAMIQVARRIVRQVGCGVVFVHHSGKALVRDGDAKQYSGRGGSALADGSRMVFTLEPVKPDDWLKVTGEALVGDEVGLMYCRPKLTWSKPQKAIYIRRDGFNFFECEYIEEVASIATTIEIDALFIEQFLRDGLLKGETYSQNDLIYRKLLPQQRTRAAVSYLIQHDRVVRKKKEGGGQGGAYSYLRPADEAPNGS